MIYDCFTFNNELDLLDLRLHELSKVVDKFVLVESTTTFSGNLKPLYYEKNKKRFAKFSHQIIHIVVNDMNLAIPSNKLYYFKPKSFQLPHLEAWSREIHQRNSIERGLVGCRANDIILISDVDEIPNHKFFSRVKSIKGPVSLEMNNYYYYINCIGSEKIFVAKALKYKYLQNLDPQEVRENNQFPIISNAGWHFSYLGGYESIKDKIRSFSHQEHNKSDFLDTKRLAFNLENALDIFNRPFEYKFVKIDKSYPKYLQDHLSQFKKYIKQDHPNQNTLRLRDELFKSRSSLYWKELELESVIKTMNYYRRYSFPYILAKIQQKIKGPKRSWNLLLAQILSMLPKYF